MNITEEIFHIRSCIEILAKLTAYRVNIRNSLTLNVICQW